MLTHSFYIFSPALAFLISCYTIYHFYTRPSLIVFFFDLGSAYCSAVILTLRTTKEEKKHIKKPPLSRLPYLPVYNAGPCIIRIPISDQILRKKKNKLLNKKVKLYNIIYFN